MADEFDPLKQTNTANPEPVYATISKTPPSNEDDLLRSPFENILKLTNKPEEKPNESTYERLNFTSTAPKTSFRPGTNPFDAEVQQTPPSTPVTPPTEATPAAAAATTTRIQSNSQEQSSASDQSYWDRTEQYHNLDYEPGPPPAYYPEEYYEETLPRRRGFAAAVDRFVQRFPVLSIFYKQPADHYETRQECYEEQTATEQVPQLVDSNLPARELTANELSLKERYSNKSRTESISLQNKEETQPVDVAIHHDSYTIYACDIGRNVLEIYDMYGKLQHVIDDQATQKSRATSIAVAYDGTIIVSSHFNHRLNMYSPDIEDIYRYKQYKLGTPGHNIHEFHYPAGLTIDFNDGYLYVCDRGNHRIKVLRPEGVCERTIDLVLYDDNQTPVAPIQIAHQKTADQFVCLIDKGDAICFLPKGSNGPTYVDPLYVLDNDGLGLQGASGIAVDHDDRIFLSDTGHHRIVICTSDGSYITHFGTEGSGTGELKRPCGLDITNDGTLVVADSGNKRLQLFGTLREQVNEEQKSNDDKNILLTDPEKLVA